MWRAVRSWDEQRGAEIDKQNSKGYAALTAAASQGHERVVELLRRRGADINKQNSDGNTALMAAVVLRLLRAGADYSAAL